LPRRADGYTTVVLPLTRKPAGTSRGHVTPASRSSHSLFWHLFVPNATVLTVACVVLIVEPANGRIPALVGGLIVMVTANLVLIRRAVSPLVRLTEHMERVDPLVPSMRLPVSGDVSEVRLLTESFNDMLGRLELERRESGRRALREREAERKRVAAELHDEIGQTLTALGLQLDRLTRQAPPELRRECEDVRDAVLASVDQVRRLARELRPEALDTLGLVPALTNLAERMSQRTGIPISRRLRRDLPALEDDEQLALFRIAQEGLTNAVRHADPRHIELTLGGSGSDVVLTVCDDGKGIDGGPQDGGILTMRERAVSLGARFTIGPRPGGGTQLRLELAARHDRAAP
jgi:two-component system, NarL family, sensor histidine kinase UhpB